MSTIILCNTLFTSVLVVGGVVLPSLSFIKSSVVFISSIFIQICFYFQIIYIFCKYPKICAISHKDISLIAKRERERGEGVFERNQTNCLEENLVGGFLHFKNQYQYCKSYLHWEQTTTTKS